MRLPPVGFVPRHSLLRVGSRHRRIAPSLHSGAHSRTAIVDAVVALAPPREKSTSVSANAFDFAVGAGTVAIASCHVTSFTTSEGSVPHLLKHWHRERASHSLPRFYSPYTPSPVSALYRRKSRYHQPAVTQNSIRAQGSQHECAEEVCTPHVQSELQPSSAVLLASSQTHRFDSTVAATRKPRRRVDLGVTLEVGFYLADPRQPSPGHAVAIITTLVYLIPLSIAQPGQRNECALAADWRRQCTGRVPATAAPLAPD